MLGFGQDTALAARRMILVTAAGWDTITSWAESTVEMCAPARLAMYSWPAGGMALSCSVTRYQLGIVFHAGAPDGSKFAVRDSGRCVRAIRSACCWDTSPAKTERNAP